MFLSFGVAMFSANDCLLCSYFALAFGCVLLVILNNKPNALYRSCTSCKNRKDAEVNGRRKAR